MARLAFFQPFFPVVFPLVSFGYQIIKKICPPSFGEKREGKKTLIMVLSDGRSLIKPSYLHSEYWEGLSPIPPLSYKEIWDFPQE